MTVLMEGKAAAEKIRKEIIKEIAGLSSQYRRAPRLCCIKACRNTASDVYIKSQARACSEAGIEHNVIDLSENIGQKELLVEIDRLNRDESVTGIMIQAPLAGKLDLEEAVSCITPQKDAEGMHPENLGRLVLAKEGVVPCTAGACIELLNSYGIKLRGKEAVVVGHSAIVGKPLSLLLLKEFATTTVCHIATTEAGRLRENVERAEVLIVAVGKPNLIKGDWIKPGAVVIDVGINRCGELLVGDVEFEAASRKASHITPVPGGVGPLTVTMLIKNVCHLFRGSFKK